MPYPSAVILVSIVMNKISLTRLGVTNLSIVSIRREAEHIMLLKNSNCESAQEIKQLLQSFGSVWNLQSTYDLVTREIIHVTLI